MRSEVVRFLIAGGSAAAINWLARILLSLVLPFEAALIVAYGIGMAAGFWLYRAFVFRAAARGSLRGQLALFLAVNAIGAAVVLAVSTLMIDGLKGLLPDLKPAARQALGHGVGIAVGAVANYLGHRLLTFASGPRAAPQSL
ncbi:MULTISPECIES: GtrA family protein [Methylorubrum]|uniref:GtrA family protein n=1 Tax=Methylorubrum TaxID=2282523 RepID=UPI00209E01AB|nr:MULTISPECIES: GtrA family protein [Methylorubrum]MCP1549056.1 putative flippase GtrA [Methylorubrum zatmanii]MCP1554332.1 putative flippase GtrA [Methylorubrum extorquens]MCP1579358.1 putative flippase GtrA [Methylorubrum extorquens]